MEQATRTSRKAFLKLIPLLFTVIPFGCNPFASSTHLTQAEAYVAEVQYDKAIEEYQKHIADRLEDSARPDWENPHFYLILIGDLELKKELPEEALKRYLEAESKGVEKELVSDRIRGVAAWHEEKNDLKGAVDVLNRFREKDQFLFDSILNRLYRELTAQEQGITN